MSIQETLLRIAGWIRQRLDGFQPRPPEPLPPDTGTPPDPPQPSPAERMNDRISLAWERWRQHAQSFVTNTTPSDDPIIFADPLLAALRIAPGNLFRADLSRMTRGDWNMVAARALRSMDPARRASPQLGEPFPGWVFALAMHSLGFVGVVLDLGWEGKDLDEPDRNLIDAIVRANLAPRPGLLVIEATPGLVDPAPPFHTMPLLVIRADAAPRFAQALRTMRSPQPVPAYLGNAPFAGVLVEATGTTPPPALVQVFESLPVAAIQRAAGGQPLNPIEIEEIARSRMTFASPAPGAA